MKTVFCMTIVLFLATNSVHMEECYTAADPCIEYAEPVAEGSNWKPNDTTEVLILAESFEAGFPAGKWVVKPAEAATAWDDVNCLAASGSRSAWCAAGGVHPQPPCSQYANNMKAWMVWGPFDLSDAVGARVEFSYFLQEEMGYDRFFFGASENDSQWAGSWFDSNVSDWTKMFMDLSNVPGAGSYVGKNAVWIGFYFESDVSNTHYGAYVDDVLIYKSIPVTPTPTPQPDLPSVQITIPTNFVHPSENFYLDGYVTVPGTPIQNVNLAFILDVYGAMFFWPEWKQQPDWQFYSSFQVGKWYVRVLPTLIWPDTGNAYVPDLHFYGALLDQNVTHIIGSYAAVTWGYGP